MSVRGEQDWPTGGDQRHGREPGAWSPVPAAREPWSGGGSEASPGERDYGRDEWIARPRGSAEGYASAQGHGDYPQPEHEPRQQPRRAAAYAFLLLLVLPLLGALAGGEKLGILFTVSCVAAALGASLLSTTSGLWWVVPCTPSVLLAVALGWAMTVGTGTATTTTATAASVFNGIAGAFPGIGAGTVAALGVATIRASRGARNRGGTRG